LPIYLICKAVIPTIKWKWLLQFRQYFYPHFQALCPPLLPAVFQLKPFPKYFCFFIYSGALSNSMELRRQWTKWANSFTHNNNFTC